MAKSLKDTLKLSPKIELKKIEKNIEETEKAVAQIHEEPIAPLIPSAPIVEIPIETVVVDTSAILESEAKNPNEITKRVTLDIPLSLHAEIKMNTFKKGITIKEYLLELARKDLSPK